MEAICYNDKLDQCNDRGNDDKYEAKMKVIGKKLNLSYDDESNMVQVMKTINMNAKLTKLVMATAAIMI